MPPKVKQEALLLSFWCRSVTATQDRRRSRRGSACSISNYLIPKGFLISFLQFYYLCVCDDNPQLDAMLSHEARVHVPERV